MHQAGGRVALPEIKLGVFPGSGGTIRVTRRIGESRAKEMMFFGEPVPVETALAWGLVNRVAAPEQLETVALELATELASNAPLAQAGNKRVIAALLRERGELDERVEAELIELRRASFASEDMREGMRAFAERRPPRWRGR